MAESFTLNLDTPNFKGAVSINTGLFIGGKFVPPSEGKDTIDVINPVTGKKITAVSIGSSKDVDIAVDVARKAYETSWGERVSGKERGKLLFKLVDLMEKNREALAAVETLNMGKPFFMSKGFDLEIAIDNFRYFAGWADKVHGKTIEVSDAKFAYTRHEPFGVVGQIIPWNLPMQLLSWKVAPALATGNVVVLKPSEITPLTALMFAALVAEAGFPPGVFNVVNGYGNTVGQAIAEHPRIEKVAFTGSTLVGRKIQIASAQSNLKAVSLELGGKSPNIIFDDADLEQAIQWTARAIFGNVGQVCCAGSRIFVQEGVYDAFLQHFTGVCNWFESTVGDPFKDGTMHGPLSSQVHFDRVMGYIDAGKKEGATLHTGGGRIGSEGYYIQPTLFTDAKPDSKIVKEEIFGPVGVVIKFKTEEEVIKLANDSEYGLAAGIYTTNNARAIRVAHALQAGTAWVNCYNEFPAGIPFGGYKQSGHGRDCGEYALDAYTQVKAVQVNHGHRL